VAFATVMGFVMVYGVVFTISKVFRVASALAEAASCLLCFNAGRGAILVRDATS